VGQERVEMDARMSGAAYKLLRMANITAAAESRCGGP